MSVLDLALANRVHRLSTKVKLQKNSPLDKTSIDSKEISKYRTQLWDKQTAAFLPSTPGLGMHVEVKDPDTKVVLSRQYGAEGRFTFTSHTPGEHQICLHSNSSKMALFTGGKLALADLGWAQPTLIQEKAIPLALDGKDLLARARTGSGKTAAYAVPIIQHILSVKQLMEVQNRPILMEKPDIVVGTPSRVLAQLSAQNLLLRSSLEMLVIDEADLVFSFGFESDLKSLLCHLPKIYQAFLMSATFNEDVQSLKKLVLHNPVTLKLQGSQLPGSSQLTQYHIRCEEEDKFLLIYTLLKLALVRGKTLIFIGTIDRCYRLKLFLEQFSIPACVLNSELPVHSRPILMEKPDIVVGTPSRVLAQLSAQNLLLRSSLEMLVIDEADLVFSFGFESDLKSLLCHLPKIYQAFLMSATFNEDVQSLKKLVLHNPVTLKLQGSQLPGSSQLTQYHIRCEEEDKFLLIYTLLKLALVRGKTLIFIGTIDRCYRLKLFLEQFSIPACVLNSELPVHSRCHIIGQFNQGFYDYIIATDEQSLEDPPALPGGHGKKGKKKKAQGRGGKDKEYSVSRGIDFQNVANVINFDFPTTIESYIHRVGRTARADNHGTALTFVLHTQLPLLAEIEDALTAENTVTWQRYDAHYDVTALNGVCTGMVTLKLQGSQLPGSSQLTQYHIRCEEEDKFLLIYTLLKLALVRGKTLIFIGTIDRCYRLKLFLEQFSIPACVLNSELPVHSRCHIIGQFNQGFYDYIIATDEQSLEDPPALPGGHGKKGKKKKAQGRGTARADNRGTALTFVLHTQLPLLAEIEDALTAENADCTLKPYEFKMKEIEGFRYRCRDAMRSVTKQAVKEARLKEIKQELLNSEKLKDAMRSVTKQAVKEARLKEIKQELLNSEKLKTYFDDNPRDFQLLRHDKALHPAIIKPHLKNVPEYLIPPTLRGVAHPVIRKKRQRRPQGTAGGRETKKNFKVSSPAAKHHAEQLLCATAQPPLMDEL
ncbi:UNVERIFIED_CONTAM: hypothetical protein FKN15_049264 [Acipenser sinensis]